VIAVVIAAAVTADRLGVFGVAPPPDRQKYDGRHFRVVRVWDGDTFDLDVPDGREDFTRVRLWGVDTPETNHPDKPPMHFGREATAFTKRLVDGRTVRIELEPGVRPRGKYGRLLAWVYLPDGRLLNEVLVREGYAYADPRYGHHLRKEFRKWQEEAHAGRRGLWQDATNKDLPYYYRDKLLPENR